METKKQTKRNKKKNKGEKRKSIEKKPKRENQTIFREGMKHETIQLL